MILNFSLQLFHCKHNRSRCRSRWENLDRFLYQFQPIKFVNLVVPSPCETEPYNKIINDLMTDIGKYISGTFLLSFYGLPCLLAFKFPLKVSNVTSLFGFPKLHKINYYYLQLCLNYVHH